MKKTLTVNLGGIVFHIDEDAYRLLDNYLNNLKQHFRRETDADEIVGDIERRISELFTEKLGTGKQVITLEDVEEVIVRLGSPEEMEAEESPAQEKVRPRRRFYRNPDGKLLGGVIGGLAAYMGWDVTICRLVFVLLLLFAAQYLLPAYIICWIIVPEARTASEKLSMRGEAVTMENIGKTVTDGFEHSGGGATASQAKPKTFLQRIGEVLLVVVKVFVLILAIVCAPVLLLLFFLFVLLMVIGVAILIDGSGALFALFPMSSEFVIPDEPISAIVMYIMGVLLAGIPLISLIFVVLRPMLGWRPMSNGLKWTLLSLWAVCALIFGLCFIMQGFAFPELLLRGWV